MLDVDYVITIHDEIIAEFGGLSGYGANGKGAIESALIRVQNHVAYEGVDDVFAIAALYAVAIAKGSNRCHSQFTVQAKPAKRLFV